MHTSLVSLRFIATHILYVHMKEATAKRGYLLTSFIYLFIFVGTRRSTFENGFENKICCRDVMAALIVQQ